MFAFDFADLKYVVSQCGETGLVAQAKADVGGLAEEPPCLWLTCASGDTSAVRS